MKGNGKAVVSVHEEYRTVSTYSASQPENLTANRKKAVDQTWPSSKKEGQAPVFAHKTLSIFQYESSVWCLDSCARES